MLLLLLLLLLEAAAVGDMASPAPPPKSIFRRSCTRLEETTVGDDDDGEEALAAAAAKVWLRAATLPMAGEWAIGVTGAEEGKRGECAGEGLRDVDGVDAGDVADDDHGEGMVDVEDESDTAGDDGG